MPLPSIKEGSLVFVARGSYAPLRCRGRKGIVTFVSKFGSCMVYFSELRETYFFGPNDLIVDEEANISII